MCLCSILFQAVVRKFRYIYILNSIYILPHITSLSFNKWVFQNIFFCCTNLIFNIIIFFHFAFLCIAYTSYMQPVNGHVAMISRSLFDLQDGIKWYPINQSINHKSKTINEHYVPMYNIKSIVICVTKLKSNHLCSNTVHL